MAAREAAIADVDLRKRPDLLVEVYGDDHLAPAVREAAAASLFEQKPAVIERALRAAAEDPRCAFAMSAIEMLAARGKTDLLPRAGRGDPGRVVCLLLNASDRQGAEREFRKLLPKRGKLTIREETQDEADGEGGQRKQTGRRVSVRDLSLDSLPKELGEHDGTVETYTIGHLETVTLIFGDDGLLSGVDKTSWSDYPC